VFALLFDFTLVGGLLARSQCLEGPATGTLDTGFSWLPCVYKQMLRWFPTFQVATKCFNVVVTNFIFCLQVKKIQAQRAVNCSTVTGLTLLDSGHKGPLTAAQ
jgi:hypothetical protein